MSELTTVVTQLCTSVDGIDWDASATETLIRRMLDLAGRAGSDELAAAVATIVERLQRASLEDGDGVAHVALSGGTLVERGAPPRALAQVLLSHIPNVLDAARRFSDLCLVDARSSENETSDGVIDDVDGVAITTPVFRRHLKGDRAGGCALAYLRQWTLPTVAALTRDRATHLQATQKPTLLEKAQRMRDSSAHWLHPLFAAQLDQVWRAISVETGRGFEVRLDGIARNFELNALLGDALVDAGLPGTRNPRAILDFLRGSSPHAEGYVKGCVQLYTWEAAKHLPGPNVPLDHMVWNEGVPTDVPEFHGLRTVLVASPTIQRTWNVGRPFSHLPADVEVVRELPRDEVAELLKAMH